MVHFFVKDRDVGSDEASGSPTDSLTQATVSALCCLSGPAEADRPSEVLDLHEQPHHPDDQISHPGQPARLVPNLVTLDWVPRTSLTRQPPALCSCAGKSCCQARDRYPQTTKAAISSLRTHWAGPQHKFLPQLNLKLEPRQLRTGNPQVSYSFCP